jgi:hypothetical protein
MGMTFVALGVSLLAAPALAADGLARPQGNAEMAGLIERR